MALQIPTGLSVTSTQVVASLTNTSWNTLPQGSDFMITATKECWIKFGTANDSAAANVAPVAANQTLTLSVAAPSDGETVTIDTQVYTYRTALTAGGTVANEVLIGGSIANACSNLAKAINLTGTAGTTYGTPTQRHATCRATSTATTVVVSAKTPGAAGNSIATTETLANGSFGGATLASGVDQTTGCFHLPDNGELMCPRPVDNSTHIHAIRVAADGVVSVTGLG